jgi:uncharacterized protein (TIGR00369 family)
MIDEQKPGVLTPGQIQQLIDDTFPQVHTGGKVLVIEQAGHRFCRIRMIAHEKNLRQGNTISGPAMFQLADFGVYIAILATNGPTALEAVTSNLNINFLSRPEMGDLIAEVRLIKTGRRLVVGEVEMHPAAGGEPVAHAIGTYMLPTK